MEIMYALLALISFLLIFIAYYAKRASEKEPVRIIQEVKAEPKKEVKAEPKKAEPKKEEKVTPPRNYGEFWKPMVEPIPYTKNRIVVDRYEISNMGRVWDKKREALLSVTKDKRNGEASVSLATKTTYTRRALKVLVATTFIGAQNDKNYIVVNCDGNPNNCAASNLRWKKSGKGRKVAM